MFGSFHFSFFVLVDEVTKNENKLRDFLYDVFCLQGKTGKMKMKNNRKINKLLHNIFVFCNFVNQNEKRKMKWAKHKGQKISKANYGKKTTKKRKNWPEDR